MYKYRSLMKIIQESKNQTPTVHLCYSFIPVPPPHRNTRLKPLPQPSGSLLLFTITTEACPLVSRRPWREELADLLWGVPSHVPRRSVARWWKRSRQTSTSARSPRSGSQPRPKLESWRRMRQSMRRPWPSWNPMSRSPPMFRSPWI